MKEKGSGDSFFACGAPTMPPLRQAFYSQTTKFFDANPPASSRRPLGAVQPNPAGVFFQLGGMNPRALMRYQASNRRRLVP